MEPRARMVLRKVSPDTDTTVDELYVNMEATEEVAVNDPARAFTPRSDEPLTERVRQGDVVPIPNQPFELMTLARLPL